VIPISDDGKEFLDDEPVGKNRTPLLFPWNISPVDIIGAYVSNPACYKEALAGIGKMNLRIFFLLTMSMLLSAAFLVAYSGNQGEIKIVNHSSRVVVAGDLAVCKQKFKFYDLMPEKSVSFHYRVTSDSHYQIQLQFDSGATWQRDVGYVTNGMDFRDIALIGESEIELMQETLVK
jgi:hypothetical protein